MTLPGNVLGFTDGRGRIQALNDRQGAQAGFPVGMQLKAGAVDVGVEANGGKYIL